ncbi:MAG TPA: T9SS type A sorting domain-containing protein, partial [Bacteroidota bacterium]|nr:T9SS type A sorting domain-containing protein [Bacteroidota bacterium]
VLHLAAGSNGDAQLGKTESPNLDSFGKLMIRDGEGNEQTLYFGAGGEMSDAYRLPPPPAGDGFDARFSTGSMVAFARTGISTNLPITISSPYYPVTIDWTNPSTTSASIVIGTSSTKLTSNGSITIPDATTLVGLQISGATALPTAFALAQNYPNPFNPSTRIAYALPVDARVTLRIYNVLGQVVATLADGEQSAGYKTIEFNFGSLSSGVYFYRLEAAGIKTAQDSFTQLRKMVLLK